jgi:ribosomal protein L44E
LLYNIFPDEPRSILDKTRQRVGPHADGIFSSAQTNPTKQLTKQLQKLSIQHTTASQTIALASPSTKMSEVHTVQSTNPKATQQPEGKTKQRKKGKGDKKPTDNNGGDKTKKWKVRYPCNLCVEDHLTHLCPRLAEGQNFVTQQQQAMLTNTFQHGKNLTQASGSTEGGSQETCLPPNNPSSANVYMVRGDAFISSRAHDYSKPSASEKGKEVDLPSLPLQIEKMLGETMTCIPKGAFKKSYHNPNARATQNYTVVEDLSQTPCAMSALEVL